MKYLDKNLIKKIMPVFIKTNINKMLNTLNYFKNFYYFSQKKGNRFSLKYKDRYPCLNDVTSNTSFDRHYVYHPAWVARIIKRNQPKIHIDISSSLHFCSMLSAFVPVEFYDYRPANLVLSNLKTAHADLLNLTFENNSIKSLSCMHVVEHIGLGRYGDPLDYDGDLKAMKELARVLSIGGSLLFVVPVGNKPIIYFNAHRIYTKEQIITTFNELGLHLEEFSLIPENELDGGLISDPHQSLLKKQKYACGCFYFKKEK